MASKRKLWSTLVLGSYRTRHESKTATYRYIQRAAGFWQDGKLRSQHITIYVDERNGHGWENYERIDLQEIVDSWSRAVKR